MLLQYAGVRRGGSFFFILCLLFLLILLLLLLFSCVSLFSFPSFLSRSSFLVLSFSPSLPLSLFPSFPLPLPGSAPAYLQATRGDQTTDAKLSPDIGLVDRALVAAKKLSPSQATAFGEPFFWFWREIKDRGTGSVDLDPANVHHNFAIFITDGEANDFDPDFKGRGSRDYPWTNNYGGSAKKSVQDGLCDPLGWDPKDCVTANVIRNAKDMETTKVMGIFVGDQNNKEAQRTLHNVSSCDNYPWDVANGRSKCPYFTSASNFDQLKASLGKLMSTLAAEVSVTSKVVTEERVIETQVTETLREEVYTCEKDTDLLLLVLLLLPLLLWLLALPTYVITKAVCCPDYGYDDGDLEDDGRDIFF